MRESKINLWPNRVSNFFSSCDWGWPPFNFDKSTMWQPEFPLRLEICPIKTRCFGTPAKRGEQLDREDKGERLRTNRQTNRQTDRGGGKHQHFHLQFDRKCPHCCDGTPVTFAFAYWCPRGWGPNWTGSRRAGKFRGWRQIPRDSPGAVSLGSACPEWSEGDRGYQRRDSLAFRLKPIESGSFGPPISPSLMGFSQCPKLAVNQRHQVITHLGDEGKKTTVRESNRPIRLKWSRLKAAKFTRLPWRWNFRRKNLVTDVISDSQLSSSLADSRLNYGTKLKATGPWAVFRLHNFWSKRPPKPDCLMWAIKMIRRPHSTKRFPIH